VQPQVKIGINPYRSEQLKKLAEHHGVKPSQWIDQVISAGWKETFPNTDIPGLEVDVHFDDGDEVTVTVDFLQLPDHLAIEGAPDRAAWFAKMLKTAAEGGAPEVRFVRSSDSDDVIYLTRQGPGVSLKFLDIANKKSLTLTMTPGLAMDYAGVIEIAVARAELLISSRAQRAAAKLATSAPCSTD
jgi:hypothetical protein